MKSKILYISNLEILAIIDKNYKGYFKEQVKAEISSALKKADRLLAVQEELS